MKKSFILVKTETYNYRASVLFYMDGEPLFYCNGSEVDMISEGMGFDVCKRAVEEKQTRKSRGVSVFTGASLFGAKGSVVVNLNNGMF